MQTIGHVGVLHPGAMGASVAAELAAKGTKVSWASSGRSLATRNRAQAAGLADAGSVAALVARSDLLLSICPPDAALDVARDVAAAGFDGVYVDANAIAPATMMEVSASLPQATVIDGGIVGQPPPTPKGTRLFLAAEDETGAVAARLLADRLQGSALQTLVLDAPAPAASALKVAYAAWTKGSTALLLTVAAYADAAGVGSDLLDEWERSQPGLAERLSSTAPSVAAKAWRFAGELEELAAAFSAEGLPSGAPEAGAELYRTLAPLRDREGEADLADVLAIVREQTASVTTSPGTDTQATPEP